MSKNVFWIRSRTDIDSSLAQSLAARGYTLTSVDDEEAINGLSTEDLPAAIIADSDMLQTAARLRDKLQSARERELPLLVISTHTDLQTRLMALRQGASAYFPPPLVTDDVAGKLAEQLGEENSAPAHKVMVVDDDPSQASFAAAILKKAGMEVCKVTESLKILDTLRSFMPELILMDVYMPDATGVELATIIREQKDLMHIPIVYLSAEHDPDKQLDALSVGGEDFLTKPISPKHLVATVRNRVDRARQLKAQSGSGGKQDGDPAAVRKHILELLEKIHSSPSEAGKATGLYYLEIDTPIALLEQINLDGIDQVMSQIRDITVQTASEEDRINRFGDFCLVVLAQRDNEAQLEELAHTLKEAIDSSLYRVAGKEIGIAMSIGLRPLADADGDASLLINQAIRASHEARTAPVRGVQVHRSQESAPPPPPPVEQPAEIDKDLIERVMDPENLRILYQPVVPLQSSDEALYQGLLRLRSGNGGLLSAGEFLPMVEQTGKILKLDRWVILKALVLLRSLRTKEQRPFRLFVSQASAALKDRGRIDWLDKSLRKTGITGEGLVLEFPYPEITEDMDLAKEYLGGLAQLGVSLSLNSTRELDSLLENLHELPANYIKITESQLRNYPDTWGKLVHKAHELDKRVIVSRIEHPELLGQLWAHDVDYIQGYFIQQPGADLNYDFTGAVLG